MTTTQKRTLCIGAAFISSVLFLYLYGIQILNPCSTDWLMEGGDLTQHYLGWKAFRFGAWQFPFGLINNLSYPDYSSVIFTDSIPLLSLLFKILSPLLPTSFQFFGLYGLLCFILSGVLSADILRRYSDNVPAVLICSTFFVLAPIMLFRMYFHTALASHWIILLGLRSMFLYEERYAAHPSRSVRLFCLLGLLSGSIHIYYAVFSAFILIGFWILDAHHTRQYRTGLYCLTSFIAVFLLTVFLMGGLSYNVSSAYDGLGDYSMNLNSFFNPMGWSSFLRDLPVLNKMQKEECLGYLGLGFIALILPSLLLWISDRQKLSGYSNRKREALLIVFLMSVFFALSPVISCNDRILFQYPIPFFVQRVWSVVRATGRFGWLPAYLLMISVFLPLLKHGKPWTSCLLAAGLVIQLADLSGALTRIHQEYAVPYSWHSQLQSTEFWEAVSGKTSVKHLIFTESFRENPLYSLTDYALEHGMTINDYYFARSANTTEQRLQESLNNLSKENLYVFPDASAIPSYDLNYYRVDGFLVGLEEKVPGMDAYQVR